jgi:hypothetical protein
MITRVADLAIRTTVSRPQAAARKPFTRRKRSI